MDLTEAMAKSNNPYFAKLGEQLGFERVYRYSKMFGLGEKAGLDIPEEQLGAFPDQPIPIARGGVGRMTSFGEGISLTNLQYAAFLSAVANGGTLYYLQYPRNQYEAGMLVPRVKRQLEIAKYLPQIREGMQGATAFGTARRAAYVYNEPVMGKTGTCTEARTHLGWFGSFNDVGQNSLVVVVLLTGAEGVSGPTAAQIAGSVYKNLNVTEYFAETRPMLPTAFIRPAAWIGQGQ
jgi:penicillin-binding protein 2